MAHPRADASAHAHRVLPSVDNVPGYATVEKRSPDRQRGDIGRKFTNACLNAETIGSVRRVRLLTALALPLCLAAVSCGYTDASSSMDDTPAVSPDLSGVGRGPKAALEALVLCFRAAGMRPTRLVGRTEVAHSVDAPVVGIVNAQVGNSVVNIFEVTSSPAHARQVAREARRRNRRAAAVGRVWYSPREDWMPDATRRVESCLTQVARAT